LRPVDQAFADRRETFLRLSQSATDLKNAAGQNQRQVGATPPNLNDAGRQCTVKSHRNRAGRHILSPIRKYGSDKWSPIEREQLALN
jgi:hypothetical protein